MNKAIIMGRLARDPELRTTQGGIPRCMFTVACDRRVPNAQGVREADFLNCVAWRERGEFVARHFTKGSRIAVEGSIQTRSYEAQDGTKRYVTEIVADNVEFCERRQDGSTASSQPADQQSGVDEFEDVEDDELPF